MSGLTTREVAERLGVTPARISQLKTSGQLDGAWTGEGRAIRYDLAKVAAKLNRELHPGQMLGNGRGTREAIRSVLSGEPDDAPRPAALAPYRDGSALAPGDLDRYELARVQKAEEEARRLRRQNQEAEGTLILASAVSLQVSRQIGQEVAEFETVLRDAARIVADRLGVDFRTVRQILIEEWRAHRGRRTATLTATADAAAMTPEEAAADI